MRRRTLLSGLTAVVLPALASARPLLTVGGKIGRRNDGDVFAFTDDEFLRLPQTAIVTSTTWTPKSRWEGPRLDAVMAHVDTAVGTALRIGALDDYNVTVPWGDMARWGIVLAHSRDGSRLQRNQWGPLFVIYPRDDSPRELGSPMTEAKFIWQVNRIDVI